MQERGLAAAQCFAGDSFIDNVLVHQFLDQHADYATGDVHATRKVSSGNRLLLTNQVQRNPSIDVSRRCAGGYTKISGIDLSHQTRAYCSECEQYRRVAGFVKHFFQQWKK